MPCEYCDGKGYEFVTPVPMLPHGSGDPMTPDDTAFVAACGCQGSGAASLGWQAAQIALQDLGLEPDVSENVYGVMIHAPGFRFGRPPEEA